MELKIIKRILIDQKEELETLLEGKKIIKREVLKYYKRPLESSLIKVITGPRRSGKSVLCLQLLQNKDFAYVNFDDERLVDLQAQDLNLILQAIYEIYQKPKFIFLDEVQNISKWELFVNRLKRKGFNLLVTGSNAKLLSRELATHLTGRHFALELFPFSFREYLDFNEFDYQKKDWSTQNIACIKEFLNQYLSFGSFPEVAQGEDYKRYLMALYSTILTKDILLRYKIKHQNTFKELANYLISNFARQITFNKLKNIFSLKSVHTAKNYFNFLEEAYLIFPLERFSYKAKERLAAPRKVYSIDTGLSNAVSIKFSQDVGHIYENIVALGLLRRKVFDHKREIFYWEDRHKIHEVDFVIKKGLKIEQLAQVCYNIENYDTKKREVKSLLRANQELECKNLLVITEDFEGEEKVKGKKIKFLPLWRWLLQND